MAARPKVTAKAASEETADETAMRVYLEHARFTFGPNHPIRCKCGDIIAPEGHEINMHTGHAEHVMSKLRNAGLTFTKR